MVELVEDHRVAAFDQHAAVPGNQTMLKTFADEYSLHLARSFLVVPS